MTGNARSDGTETETVPALPPTSRWQWTPPNLLVLVGGAAIVIGCFLPWVEARSIFGEISTSGMDGGGDGPLVLLLGGLILGGGLLLANQSMPRPLLPLGIIGLAIIVGVIFWMDFQEVERRIRELERDTELARGSVGIGLWILAGGCAAAALGAFLRLNQPQPPAESLAPPQAE